MVSPAVEHFNLLASAAPLPVPPRRSGNYRSSPWSYEVIQSLETNVDEMQTARLRELIEEARGLFATDASPVARLELVDTIQQLGIGYHFPREIKGALDFASSERARVLGGNDLRSASLLLRLLRENGYEISQDILEGFRDEAGGGFDPRHGKDMEGLLSLYEASFLAFDGENLMDEAKAFATKHLKGFKGSDDGLRARVAHALELPLHWRARRLQTRWFIDVYAAQANGTRFPVLFELAKLDYNIVQMTHRKEVQEISRRWSKLGLLEHLSFARDRVMECYIFALGICSSEPQFGYCRKWITDLLMLVTIVDDVYDIYGTMEELKFFTDAIEMWDISKIGELPRYMKIVFLTVFNCVNELGYEILRDKNVDVTLHLKNLVEVLCKAYYLEAKWYHNRYIPTLEEYTGNGWKSSSGPTVMGYVFLILSPHLTKEALDMLFQWPDLIHLCSLVYCLLDDLATSETERERGDVPKSVDCYMYHENVTRDVACDHISSKISETWKKINQCRLSNPLIPMPVVEAIINGCRINQIFYQNGDGFGFPDKTAMKDHVRSLVTANIP